MQPAQIRFRTTIPQRFLPMAPTAVILVAFFLASLGTNRGMPIPLRLFPLAGLVAGTGLGSLPARRFGVLLTEDELVALGLSVRRIRLADVQGIRIEPFWGAKRVVVYEAGGRRTRLRAPVSGFMYWDRGFTEKFHTIGQWWLTHRGPDWTPVPPAVR